MKKFVLAMFVAFAFFAFEMIIPKSSEAGYHAPWYACYVESGGTLQKCVGPFDINMLVWLIGIHYPMALGG